MVCSRHDSRVAAVGPDKRPSPEPTATDKVAPIPAVRTTAVEPPESTLCRLSRPPERRSIRPRA